MLPIHRRVSRALALFLACHLTLSAAGAVRAADDLIRFQIAAGDAVESLSQFSLQSGVQMLFLKKQVEGHATPALTGDFGTKEGLTKLLDGTGLTFEFVNERTVRIAPIDAPAAATADQVAMRLAQLPARAEGSGPEGQATSSQNNQAESERDGEIQDSLEEIIVTGTHIRGITPSSSPLTSFGRAEIERTGAGSVGEFLRTVPQNFAGVDSGTSLGSGNNQVAGLNMGRGTSVDLHGLGPGATLVLLNGHRLAPTGLDGSLVDVSIIPVSAIERVDVLTDGASALYGADAVAGVVNFVLRQDFEGFDTTARYGAATQGGGREINFAQAAGAAWDRGSVLGVYDFYDQNAVLSSQRSYVPDTGGEFTLLPSQKRHSGFVSGRQRLSDSSQASFDAYFSQKKYVDNYNDGTIVALNSGRAKGYGASATYTHDLGPLWQARAALSFSGSDANQVTESFGTQALFDTRSTVTSVDVLADGPLFAGPDGSSIRTSVGVHRRRESFDDRTTAIPSAGNSDRNVTGVFAEVFAPLIRPQSGISGVHRLEASLAVRHDSYEGAGSAFSPRLGLTWQPLNAVAVRGTVAKSFRAATLAQLTSGRETLFVFPIANPESPSGVTNTILRLASNNPDLEPERSRSWTIGLDFRPGSQPAIEGGITFFHVRYTDRIASPPTTITDLFLLGEAMDPFIDRAPTSARVAAIYDNPMLINPVGIAAEDIGAIYDGRIQNIGRTTTEGLDGMVRFRTDLPDGELSLEGAATYYLQNETIGASGFPAVKVFDRIFYPAAFKGRAAVSWSRDRATGSLAINYTDSYVNDLISPTQSVSSWVTFDAFLALRLPADFSFSLSAQNLFDRDPPGFEFPAAAQFLNFDPQNASPRGRFLAVKLNKSW